MSDGKAYEDLLHQKIRWPRAGDRLFTQSPKREDNAYIERRAPTRLVMMILGYKRGADLMAERAKSSQRDRDALVYPIIFNYRQYIELSLKELIAVYGPSFGIPAVWNTHDLSTLWNTFSKVLARYGIHNVEEVDGFVGAMIAEFAKIDPRSFSYRYPVDPNGVPVPIAQHELDIGALADAMASLETYFVGCDGYLDHLQGAGP